MALDDLALRLDFLAHRYPSAVERAGELIISAAEKLAAFPHSGRPYGHGGLGERECLVPFGQFGYSLRYRVDGTIVVILRIKHQREAGY